VKDVFISHVTEDQATAAEVCALLEARGVQCWIAQLTHFTDRTIADFAWSRDGKHLALVRTTATSDIVLFKGLKK